MSTTISSMPSVSLPRFVSASSTASSSLQKKKGGDGAASSSSELANQTTWGSGSNLAQASQSGGGDPLDFDLLAEYLLDDCAGSTDDLGISFDFSAETPPLPLVDHTDHTGIVSPDQAETSFADPLADATEQLKQVDASAPNGDIAGDLAHVQHVIATQAAAAEQNIAAPKAPKPSVGAPKLSAPPLNSFPASAPTSTVPAPAPGGAVPGFQHHPPMPTADANKRRRVDASAPVVAGATAAPVGGVMNMNGQLLPQNFGQRGGRQKTQAQIDRRRERNRILARRTRLRKKFFFESLQKDVTDMQRENAVLKDIVKNRMNPDVAKGILDQCTANDELPCIMAEDGDTELDRQDFSFIQSVQKSQQCFVITDPSLQDNPIVYASDDFLNLTGYSREDVLGRNCRFLQGTETSPAKVAEIQKTVANGEDCSITLINYTADGTAFWNNLFIAALRDAENNIVNFIGVIVKVASPEPGDPEAGKKLPGEASPNSVMDAGSLNDVFGSSLDAAAAAAEAAEGTVKAIEGAVTAAVAAAPTVTSSAIKPEV